MCEGLLFQQHVYCMEQECRWVMGGPVLSCGRRSPLHLLLSPRAALAQPCRQCRPGLAEPNQCRRKPTRQHHASAVCAGCGPSLSTAPHQHRHRNHQQCACTHARARRPPPHTHAHAASNTRQARPHWAAQGLAGRCCGPYAHAYAHAHAQVIRRAWATASVVEEVDAGGDVPHDKVKAVQEAAAIVSAARNDTPVPLGDAAQVQHLVVAQVQRVYRPAVALQACIQSHETAKAICIR